MSTEEIKLVAESRSRNGSSEARRLRNEGWLPAVIYGDGKNAHMIKLNEHDFEQMLRHHTSEYLMVSIEIDGKQAKRVLLKEVQHHALSGRPVHADFQEVSLTERLTVDIEIDLIGEPEGVTMQGGVLEHSLRTVEVECLPGDIVEKFEADVSALMIGDSITVADIVIDTSKYEVLTEPDIAVATVAPPRVEEEPAEEEEALEGEEAAEPERIGEKADDEDEEGESSDDKKDE